MIDASDSETCGHVVIWLLLLAMPFWLPAVGGYPSSARRVVVHGTGGHVAQFPAWLYRRSVLRPRRLFRPRRLWRRPDHQICRAEHLAGIAVGVLVGTIAAALIGP